MAGGRTEIGTEPAGGEPWPEIGPCPFCGAPGAEPDDPSGSPVEAERLTYVPCSACGATGPDGATIRAAIERWNGRAG